MGLSFFLKKSVFKFSAAIIPLLMAAGCTTVPAGHNAGPLTIKDRSIDGDSRLRALGPIYEKRETADGRSFTAIRPFYSELKEPERNRRLREYAWPLGMVKDFRNERYWRFGVFYGTDSDIRDPNSRWRCVLFPFIFTGRDSNGNGYFAVFPIGGTIHDFIGMDKITFALWPLYSYNAVGDVESRTLLWPLFSRTHGGGQDRLRIFPFYARSRNEGRWVKTFIMWPIWTDVRYDYPKGKGGGFIIFPLFGHIKTTDQETWMVIPPLFQSAKGQQDSERKFVAMWPIVQYSKGEERKFYIFPLWGKKQYGKDRMWFALWPIVDCRQTARSDYRVDRFQIAPFYYNESRRSWVKEGVEAAPDPFGRNVRLWPLFRYKRENDRSTLRFVELWFGASVGGAERNLTPLWTIYTHERSGDKAEDEFLWGLFRYRRGGSFGKELSVFPLFRYARNENGTAREWSAFGGLAGGYNDGLRRETRLLYFLKIKKEAKKPDGAQNDNP